MISYIELAERGAELGRAVAKCRIQFIASVNSMPFKQLLQDLGVIDVNSGEGCV